MKRKREQPAPSPIEQAMAQYKEEWRPQVPFYRPPADATRVAERPLSIDKPGDPETFPIRPGETSDRVMELRIRLAGFGGLKPGDLFDEDTGTAVKTFERDVMGKATPTGIVDLAFAQRLDRFAVDWPISFFQLRCKCGTCGGFGDGSNKGKYIPNDHKEKHHKYEYPGIHRALLWGTRALFFYCTIDLKQHVRFLLFFSGYRCRIDNESQNPPRPTSNHMGKAVDIWFESFSKGDWTRSSLSKSERKKACNQVREVASNRLSASLDWATQGKFGLEPDSDAPTWVHMDVREWPRVFLDDSFFVKSSEALEGQAMVEILSKPMPFNL